MKSSLIWAAIRSEAAGHGHLLKSRAENGGLWGVAPIILRLALILTLVVGMSATLFAQGNDNPTGVAGTFNGNSTTGCSYDPYTGNTTRTIPDLVVSGAVGAYPLVWARTMNSRGGNGTFGAGGGWSHSYQWKCVALNDLRSNTALAYTISYPDGRVISFTGNPYVGPRGVKDRVGVSVSGDTVVLFLSDGGQVYFPQRVINEGGEYEFYIDPPSQILDPGNLATTLNYDSSGRLVQVTEPAQRWLKVSYSGNNISRVDAGYGAGTITQSVSYGYDTETFGGTFSRVPYNLLHTANYSDGTAATYTYQASNVSLAGAPLISTCQDVRYPGPMKNIAYEFVAGGVAGQLWKEEHISGTPVVTLTMSGATRTETRGDGASRTWTYGATSGGTTVPYLLHSYTDFMGKATTLGYDAQGLVSAITDRNGHTTSFEHHPWSGAVTKVIHPGDGSFIQYDYDPNGYHLEKMTDELQHVTTYKLNPPPSMTPYEIDYPDNGIEGFDYNGFNQVLHHTMPSNTSANGSGGVETYTYDARGLLRTYTPPATPSDPSPGSHPTTYDYDTSDRLQTVTDPNGHQTILAHNPRGQLTSTTTPAPDPGKIVYAYFNDGTLQSVSAYYTATGATVTSYTYDDYKRMLTKTAPGDSSGDATHTAHYWYDKDGAGALDYSHTDANVTRLVTPEGRVSVTAYDNDFRKMTVTVAPGTNDEATTKYTYDDGGNLQTMVEPKYYPNGVHWTYHYDARDRLTDVDDPAGDANSLGHTVTYTYDALNKTSERRANNQVISYDSYDYMNRLTRMTVHQSPTPDAVTTYIWTKAGKLASMKDPNLNLYSYGYDELNRLVLTTFPSGGGTETRLYDFAGNLKTFKNRAGATHSFTYDSRNRVKTDSWSTGDPQDRVFTYDEASRMTSCNTGTTANGTFINFAYYTDNSLQSQEEWGTGVYGDGTHRMLIYGYDKDGNRNQIEYPDTYSFSYDYSAREQLNLISDAGDGSPIGIYTYDDNGNLYSRALTNGTSTEYDTDSLNRITSIAHDLADGEHSFAYGYDAVGNRKWAERDGDAGDVFGYDLSGAVTATKRNVANPRTTAVGAQTIVYDGSGNRVTFAADGPTDSYGVNNLNQYTSRATGTPTPSPTATPTPTATPKPPAATPTFTPAPGAYPATDFPKTITIKTTSSGAQMRYTTNGSNPTETVGTLINGTVGPASVPAGATLKAIAYGTNYSDSAVASGTYTAEAIVAKPTFTPVAGSYPAGDYPKTVTITTATSGAQMRYTTNASNPSPSVGTLINGPSGTASVPAGATLKAIAFKSGMTNSAVASGGYAAQAVIKPTLSPNIPGGDNVYPNVSVMVTFHCATSGAMIHYAKNRAPTASDPAVANGGTATIIGLSNAITTVEAIGMKSGCPNSAAGSAQYYSDAELPNSTPTPPPAPPACATPTFTPGGGAYPANSYPKTVTISTTTSGAKIRYTTDGYDPSPTYGTVINGSSGTTLPFASGVALKAIAYKTDGTRSPSFIAHSGQYTTMGVVTTPVISPGGYLGCSSAPIHITMTTTTSGATIRWTADGSNPTPNHGNIYTTYIYTSPTLAGLTLKAMAYKSGMSNSGTDTAFYQLFPANDCGGNEADPPPGENGTNATPVYDTNGNLTTGLDGSTYTYDSQNRLIKAVKGGVTENFYYDGLNRQVARVINGVASYLVYDGWNVVAEYSPGAPHLPTQAWLYGPGGMVKELTNNYYYYEDGSGSTTQVTDDEGTVLESYQYDLQGTPSIFDGAGNPITESSIGVRHLFTGQQWYGALRLYDLRNRYYSPDTGRFLQPDPIGFGGDASNMYRYCGNNPVNRSDPGGEAAVFHYSPSGGYYSYWVNAGWQSLVGGFVPCSGGQCAAGAQILSGGYVGGAYHDVPKTSTWIQGTTLGSSTTDGTVVATGWQNGGYPSLNPDAYAATYGSNATVNHTGVLIGFDGQGNAWILNQSVNSPLHVSILSPEQQKQWNEVNVAKSNGPYDPARSGTNGGRGAGGTGMFPGGLVIFGRGPNGAAFFNAGTGWAPIGEAPADVRWAPNSGTGNYIADRTTQFFEMYSGPQPGEGFHPVSFNKE